MRRALFAVLIAVAIAPGHAALAQESAVDQDSLVDQNRGLAAWDRIYAVASHPRCTNCHVGPQDAPMWEGLGYGSGARHGMNVVADESRIGAETIPCRTCHITAASANAVPHAAPQIEEAWRLAPVEMAWLGLSSEALCALLRDGEATGTQGIADLVSHLERSPFVAWGFDPGAGRSAPPGDLAEMVRDVALWGRAGAPCR